MRTRRREGQDVRRVLAGMVQDRTVLSRIANQWTAGGLFDAPWANLVGGWCIDHFRKYGEPPNGQLRPIFERWTETAQAPDETVKGVETFLETASRENEGPINSDFLLDAAGRYFNAVRVRKAILQAEELEEIGRTDEAHDLLAGLRRVELGGSSVVRVVSDWDAWRQAYDTERRRPLVYYPGRAQEFIGRWMLRDTLIGFMAPDKSGKSVYLLDLAVRAVRTTRSRVLYIDAGDNSQDQVMRRLGSRVARIPSEENWKERVRYPVAIARNGQVQYEIRRYERPVDLRTAYRMIQRVCRGMDRMRVVCRPNSTMEVAHIDSLLNDWDREDGWTPDVVVIDYADILAPPFGVRDTLDQINAVWKALRRLSQERHCLVVTATQSSALAYGDKATVLTKKHFSGRKTKLAEVNGMIGVNVTDKERAAGVARQNWIVRREGAYRETAQLPVAGCWEFYDPIVAVADGLYSTREDEEQENPDEE